MTDYVEDKNADKTKDVNPSSRITFIKAALLVGKRREVRIFHSR